MCRCIFGVRAAAYVLTRDLRVINDTMPASELVLRGLNNKSIYEKGMGTICVCANI